MNRLQPENTNSNLNTTIAWSILGSIVLLWAYLQPVRIQSAKLGTIQVVATESDNKYLAQISEFNSRPEQFEVSQLQAKLLKNLSLKTEDCYINVFVANGLIPFNDPRFIVNIDSLCQKF